MEPFYNYSVSSKNQPSIIAQTYPTQAVTHIEVNDENACEAVIFQISHKAYGVWCSVLQQLNRISKAREI